MKEEIKEENISRIQKPENAKYVINVTTEDERDLVCFLRKPNKKEISMILNESRKPDFDILSLGERLLRSCFLAGDEEILTDEDALISASIQASNIVTILDGNLKKL